MEKMSKDMLYYLGGIDIFPKINSHIFIAAETRVNSALFKKDANILAVIKTSSFHVCELGAD